MPNKNFDPVLDRPVWGAEKIGEVLNRSERQTFYLLEHGLLDADKRGNRWCSTPRRLLRPQHSKRSDVVDA